jgi:hypothetical protein
VNVNCPHRRCRAQYGISGLEYYVAGVSNARGVAVAELVYPQNLSLLSFVFSFSLRSPPARKTLPQCQRERHKPRSSPETLGRARSRSMLRWRHVLCLGPYTDKRRDVQSPRAPQRTGMRFFVARQGPSARMHVSLSLCLSLCLCMRLCVCLCVCLCACVAKRPGRVRDLRAETFERRNPHLNEFCVRIVPTNRHTQMQTYQ